MLCEALELDSLARNPTFHVPRIHVRTFTSVHLMQKLSKCFCKVATCSISVLWVDVLLVCLEEKKLHQGFSVCQTLQNRVHEARVSEVAQTGQPLPGILTLKHLCKRQLHPFIRINILKLLRQLASILALLDLRLWIVGPRFLSFFVKGNLPLQENQVVVSDVDLINQLMALEHSSVHFNRQVAQIATQLSQ